LANEILHEILNNAENKVENPSINCHEAATRLACVISFPECPFSATSLSSISYFFPCKLQCEQVNAACSNSFTLDCSR
jgi:hypothetical protein